MMSPKISETALQRRSDALNALVDSIPYIQYLGVRFNPQDDRLTAFLPFNKKLIGNPIKPALHGGVTVAFLEVTAMITLNWFNLNDETAYENLDFEKIRAGWFLKLPETIDFSVDYLRAGLPEDAYARAHIIRSGRRYASVHVEGWQNSKEKLFAYATGHFVLPQRPLE
jgi:acyl-coenzyme A thioesterase PaaI-like protein